MGVPFDAHHGAFSTDIDQTHAAPKGGSEGMGQDKTPEDRTDSADERAATARNHSRMEEILRLIEEYVSEQREVVKALRKKLFH
jgi:hypothetical protein